MNGLAPWNASWTGEDRYEIRNCRWAGGKPAIWSPHLPGEGRPIFAKPHMVRQRRSVAEYRCTVCGNKTHWSDRWWFQLGNPIDGWAFATTEAPVHYDCAVHSMKVCPHLKKLGARPVLWQPPYAVVSAIVGGMATETDFGLNLNGRKVIGHLKFVWKYPPFSTMARS